MWGCASLQISSLKREFSSYKVRAHALLQKKDAELAAAKDSEQLKALEEALKVHAYHSLMRKTLINVDISIINRIVNFLQEAENEVLSITEERDRALRDLQSAMANHERELAERCHYY